MIVVDETEPVGEVDAPFEPRDISIRRGVNVRDYYEFDKEIGRGKFGTVYKCREKNSGLRLAAKFVQASKKVDRVNVEREVEIMKILRHPRLIQLYDVYDDGKKEICLLLELIEGGELFERVVDDDFILTEKACTIFVRQICEGIEFMHKQSILHLDMKPENILCLTRAGNRVKLIDFGLARKYDPSKKLQILFGTPEFVAPEVVNFERIGFGTDLWSVGIITYVLLSGLSPFMGESDVETMANVTIGKYDFDDEAFNDVSDSAKDFVSRLLVKDLDKRMTAQECLEHAWLKRRPAPIKAPEAVPKPEVPSVPVAAIPAAFQGSQGPQGSQKPEVLGTTKTNLKEFVERWSSHPNSPYIFDSPRRCVISPNGINWSEMASRTSLTGLSPSTQSSFTSPVGSLPSSPPSPDSWDNPESFFNYSFDSAKNSQSQSTTNFKVPTEFPSTPSHIDAAAKVDNSRKGCQVIDYEEAQYAEIEKTALLLKSVKETLIKQMETTSGVRDRTGARAWQRRGSGSLCIASSSPGTKSKEIPLIHTNPSIKRLLKAAASLDESFSYQHHQTVQQESSATVGDEHWEVHPPVEARMMGWSKRQQVTVSSNSTTIKINTISNNSTTTQKADAPSNNAPSRLPR